MVVFLQMLFASMITYIFTVTLVRISILLLYRRIFDIKPFRILTTALIAACIAWGLSICAANIFQCHTISDAFKPEVVAALDGRCINLQAMFYGTLGTGFTLDLIILLLPFQQIWGLRLERRRKIELMAILGLGGLACLASIMRIVALGSLKQTDLTYRALRRHPVCLLRHLPPFIPGSQPIKCVFEEECFERGERRQPAIPNECRIGLRL
ncbi:MAG: hypothetical protein Q9224_007333 [Gallowayella concinna]